MEIARRREFMARRGFGAWRTGCIDYKLKTAGNHQVMSPPRRRHYLFLGNRSGHMHLIITGIMMAARCEVTEPNMRIMERQTVSGFQHDIDASGQPLSCGQPDRDIIRPDMTAYLKFRINIMVIHPIVYSHYILIRSHAKYPVSGSGLQYPFPVLHLI